MITKQQLIEQISANLTKVKVLALSKILREQKFALHDLIAITFHDDDAVAFRAAWLLENVFLKDSLSYSNELSYLLESFLEVEYPSCQRHYAKIMMHITAKKAPATIKAKLEDIDLGPVVEKLFGWLIDPNIKIAVKVAAAEALFNLRNRYLWINDELADQIKFLMRDGTAAMQARGRALLQKLAQ